jgi:DNA-binding beta-propeller fold protein YncE
MRSRSLVALFVGLGSCLALFAGLDTRKAPEDPPNPPVRKGAVPAAPRVLPGLLADGSIQLPNQWKLRPAGRQLEVGNFPVNLALHPSGQYLAVLHAGWQEHEVMILDLNKARPKIVSRVSVDQTFYGLCFSPDGRRLYASGGEFEVVHEFDFSRGLLGNHRAIGLAGVGERLVVGGLAMDAAGRDLFACCTWGDLVVRVPVENPENRAVINVGKARPAAKGGPKGEPPSPPDGRKDPKDGDPRDREKASTGPGLEGVHPYACLPDPDGKRLYVSLWMDAAVAVVDLERNEVVKRLPTAAHPTEMALDPKTRALYVACANSTQVSVFDTKDYDAVQTINCALYPTAPSGNTPNSLTLIADAQVLLVANADASNLSVFNVADPAKAVPLGFIPTGWYPTSVRHSPIDGRLYVANGKGVTSKPNRYGPNPIRPGGTLEYIGGLFKGTVSILDMPKPAALANLTRQAFACSPLQAEPDPLIEGVGDDNPIPRKVGDPSPIKHVIYVIKENRTYDQVFGDLPQGNGEKELCLFPEPITPNHHKLATEFVLLDNFYVDGEVSADGHEWSMGAYATDFVEKYWPLSYRGSPRQRFGYPSEGHFDYAARPAGGYIWDRCAEAKVTYRSYGEWIQNGKKKADGTYEDGKATVKALEGHFDPKFRGFDLDYPDVQRADRFIEELHRFEKDGGFPQLQIVRLPNDHTSGTKVGAPTPIAAVADNDLALGRVVEAVSKSKFWKETAIFVLEDDAQNGPDHVDAHRSPCLVISPYTKRKVVDSTMYSTSSLLRTIELVLGLKPMSQFDLAARPMSNAFTARADFTPYAHEVPKADLKAVNVAGAWGAEWSEKANLAKEDQEDDLKFNEVIWKAVKGQQSRMPPPVRAAFFLPKVKPDGGDDDDKGPARKDDDD